MPIYEYKCKKCSKTYEMLQRVAEPEANACVYCGGPAGKLISLSAFHLKGTGWYATDYAGKNPACGARKEQQPSPSCAGGACTGGSCSGAETKD